MAMHRMPDLLEVWGRSVPVVHMKLNGTSPFGRHYLPYLSMPSEHSSSEADAVALAWLLDWVGISGSTEPCRGMSSVRSRSAVLTYLLKGHARVRALAVRKQRPSTGVCRRPSGRH